jgi:hypothetical protein
VKRAHSTEPRASASGQTLYANVRNFALVEVGLQPKLRDLGFERGKNIAASRFANLVRG